MNIGENWPSVPASATKRDTGLHGCASEAPLNVSHNGLGQTDSATYDHTLENSWWVEGTVVS